jgi:hypothetical protein
MEPLRVLVYCHPKKIPIVEGKATDHWLSDYINSVIDEVKNGRPVIIETVDITGDPDYLVETGFSGKFIEDHLNFFDIVIVPDCGGELGILYGKEPLFLSVTAFLKIIWQFLRIVKPGGIVYQGKITKEQRELLSKRLDVMKRRNDLDYRLEDARYGDIVVPFVVITKLSLSGGVISSDFQTELSILIEELSEIDKKENRLIVKVFINRVITTIKSIDTKSIDPRHLQQFIKEISELVEYLKSGKAIDIRLFHNRLNALYQNVSPSWCMIQ